MRLLLFSRDLGGANQLAALYEILHGLVRNTQAMEIPSALRDGLGLSPDDLGGLETVIVAKDFARQTWQNERIQYEDWDRLVAVVAPELRAESLLKRVRPDLLITATSDVDDRTDVGLWSAARKAGIPSIAFVDHGVCLRERFVDSDLQVVMPDKVFLPDADLVAEMRQISGPAGKLIVSGDLHLLRLPAKARAISANVIATTRRHWDIGDDDYAILFPSEPRREIAKAGRTFDFFEDDCLRMFARYLAKRGPLLGFAPERRPVIVVRPHPKDTPGKFYDLVNLLPVRAVIDRTVLVVQAIMSADIVAGLDSTVMFEAEKLGRPVVGLIRNSLFIARAGRDRLVDVMHDTAEIESTKSSAS